MSNATHVGVLHVTVHLGQGTSLKDKRSVIKGVLAALHRRFNVSAAEVGYGDSLRRSAMAVAAVSNSAAHTNSVLDGALNYLEAQPELSIEDVQIELL